MKILLTSNASYVPPRGGSTHSNLAFLRALVEHGHSARVIAAAAEDRTPAQQRNVRQELQEQGLSAPADLAGERFPSTNLNGIEVLSVRDLTRHVRVLPEHISSYQPDWVLVSSEDVSHTLLKEASRIAPERLIYMAHTPQFFPAGPASWNPDPAALAALRSARGVIAISGAMASYLEQHTGIHADVIHPPIYGPGPFPALGDFDHGCIGMVNPCAVKGISLFLTMADALSDEKFAVVPGWGTTQDDLTQLANRRNITILSRARNIEDVLKKLKILLMPSLWLEGFGLIAMEAMLRGVPVIASDSGGLREAKGETRFLIPVNLIEKYEPVFDDRSLPRPVIPEQNVEPWIASIRTLASSRAEYDREKEHQQFAAKTFVNKLDPSAIEHFLSKMTAPLTAQPDPIQPASADLAGLSESKRLLLIKRLKARQLKQD